MKTIGLIGGMSWESTLSYYTFINEGIKAKLGGLHSAQCLLYSVDFAAIEQLQSENRWEEAGVMLAHCAEKLEGAGVDFILIATNTMHKVYDAVQKAVRIPVVHIVDVCANALKKKNITKVALLGTQYTIKEAFYKDRLGSMGIDVFLPDENDTATINTIIFQELCQGIIQPASRDEFLRIINKLCRSGGAQAALLACTEIALLIKQSDTLVPLFDSTEQHARAAVALALGESF